MVFPVFIGSKPKCKRWIENRNISYSDDKWTNVHIRGEVEDYEYASVDSNILEEEIGYLMDSGIDVKIGKRRKPLLIIAEIDLEIMLPTFVNVMELVRNIKSEKQKRKRIKKRKKIIRESLGKDVSSIVEEYFENFE